MTLTTIQVKTAKSSCAVPGGYFGSALGNSMGRGRQSSHVRRGRSQKARGKPMRYLYDDYPSGNHAGAFRAWSACSIQQIVSALARLLVGGGRGKARKGAEDEEEVVVEKEWIEDARRGGGR